MDNPILIPKPFAQARGKNTIENILQPSQSGGAATWTDGFPPLTSTPPAAGEVAPDRLDFNGIFYALSSHLFFSQSGGLYKFNQEYVDKIGGYPLGAVLLSDDNSKTYASTVNNNQTNPNVDLSEWIIFSGDSYSRSEVDSTFAKLADFRHEEYGDTDVFYLPNGLVIQGFTGTSGAWVNYPVAMSSVFPAIACAGYTTTQSDSITVADYNNTSMFVVMRNGTGGGIVGKFNALVIGKEL